MWLYVSLHGVSIHDQFLSRPSPFPLHVPYMQHIYINLSISPFCQHFCCLPVNYPFSHYSISNMTYLLSSIVYINVSLPDQANTCWQMINRIIVWTCLNMLIMSTLNELFSFSLTNIINNPPKRKLNVYFLEVWKPSSIDNIQLFVETCSCYLIDTCLNINTIWSDFLHYCKSGYLRWWYAFSPVKQYVCVLNLRMHDTTLKFWFFHQTCRGILCVLRVTI